MTRTPIPTQNVKSYPEQQGEQGKSYRIESQTGEEKRIFCCGNVTLYIKLTNELCKLQDTKSHIPNQ